jgi:hypothetical protein
MKKLLFIIATVLYSQYAISQVTDSVATAVDTIPKTAVPPAAAPAPTPAPQEKSNRTFNEKFGFGLGFGFWTSTRTTYFEIAPSFAYRFPKALTTGIGYRYIYQHDKDLNNDLNSYGPNVFARLNLFKGIYFWTEYEWLNNQYFIGIDSEKYSRETESIDSWFVGLGIQRSLGKKGRGGLSFQVLYNVLYDQDQYSPYYSAWTYRVGYFF